ncbi:centromere protein T [Naviculisporaceae sp. PSN 640]
MVRESRPTAIQSATPARATPNAVSPTSASRPTIAIRTPGSQARGLRSQQAQPGLSASGRKPAPGPNATPHARAAFRTLDSRRAAILTPHRARRRSVRETRETPRNFLLSLGRVLARNTEPISTSSSSPGSGKESNSEPRNADTILEDDDEDEELPKRPRLSLPIDYYYDDDSPLRPHRSAGLEDEDFTIQSIEVPRRAASEMPRLSMASTRISDYFFNANELRSEDVGIDSGFFPPTAGFGEDDNVEYDAPDDDYDRLDSDPAARAGLGGRDSDFGIVVPEGLDEQTFLMAPQIQESPTHQPPPGDDDDMSMDGNEPLPEWGGEDDDVGGDDDQGHLSRVEDRSTSPDERRDSSPLPDPEVSAKSRDANSQKRVKKKGKKVSKYGIEYPSLPPAVVKRLATTFAKTSGTKGKISPDALQAIMQASDWFFEQLGDDLQAYAKHAHRKTIDESDMLTLMRRQRQINSQTTPFALAQRYLPRELLQELRMPPPAPTKKRKKSDVEAHGDEDIT